MTFKLRQKARALFAYSKARLLAAIASRAEIVARSFARKAEKSCSTAGLRRDAFGDQ